MSSPVGVTRLVSEHKPACGASRALPPGATGTPPERWAMSALGAINQRDSYLSNAKTSLRAVAWGEATYPIFQPEISRQLQTAIEAVDRALDELKAVRNVVYQRRFDSLAIAGSSDAGSGL